MSYKVLSQIRANGTQYYCGDMFPSNLKKVDYNELLDKGYLELELENEKNHSIPSTKVGESLESKEVTKQQPQQPQAKRIQKNIKEN